MNDETTNGSPAAGLAGLLDALPVGIFRTGPDMRIRQVNPAAARLLGIEPSQALGRPCEEVFCCSTCGEGCGPEEALRTGQTRLGYATHLHPGASSPRAVKMDAVPLEYGEVAVILGEVGPAEPVTSDEKMREALHRAAGNVTRAARLLGVHRTTLWRWMSTGNVHRDEFFPT